MKRQRLLLLLFVVLPFLTWAEPGLALPVEAGDWISAYNGPGTTNGGEFIVNLTDTSGNVLTSDIFRTFCLEINEYFDYYGQPLKINSVTTYAQNGGAGGATDNKDPISVETAWLYYQFSTQSLIGYDYFDSTKRRDDANSLQYAIWLLENEITSTSDQQALSWIAAAEIATKPGGWTNNELVFVMNMVKADGSRAQDWLVAQPVPEPASMILFGTGLLCFGTYNRIKSRKS